MNEDDLNKAINELLIVQHFSTNIVYTENRINWLDPRNAIELFNDLVNDKRIAFSLSRNWYRTTLWFNVRSKLLKEPFYFNGEAYGEFCNIVCEMWIKWRRHVKVIEGIHGEVDWL